MPKQRELVEMEFMLQVARKHEGIRQRTRYSVSRIEHRVKRDEALKRAEQHAKGAGINKTQFCVLKNAILPRAERGEWRIEAEQRLERAYKNLCQSMGEKPECQPERSSGRG